MRFKEIKPGMVIHCPKEEDARVLLENLEVLGYEWGVTGRKPTQTTQYAVFRGDTCYKVRIDEGHKVILVRRVQEEKNITEFSDLIEPDSSINSPADSPMTAKALLEFLKKYREIENGILTALFGYGGLDLILDDYTPQEIVDKITAYEAAKKAPKLKDVECGWRCEISYTDDITDRYDLWGVSEEAAKADAKEKAETYTAKTGRRAAVDVWFICRVKEDE